VRLAAQKRAGIEPSGLGAMGLKPAYFMRGTPGEDTGPTNTEAVAMGGRVPSRGVLSRI